MTASELHDVQPESPSEGKWMCLPDHVSPVRAIDEVIRYIDEHPESRGYPAAWLVVKTMWENRRCDTE